ncbi:unnamed protein product, partial [Closterium sp. NIES-54]
RSKRSAKASAMEPGATTTLVQWVSTCAGLCVGAWGGPVWVCLQRGVLGLANVWVLGVGMGNVASLLQRSKRDVRASAMEWAIPLITSGKLKSVVDPALENNYPPGGMKAFANVAVMCVQKSAAQRPTMAEVATRLSVIQQKVQDLHIQGEEPKYNFQPTIGTGAPAGAAAAAAAPIPRAQSAPRPKSPAPKVPQKKAGEKSGSGAGAKAKAKDAGVGEGKEVKGNKVGGKG